MQRLFIPYMIVSALVIGYLILEIQKLKEPGILHTRGIIISDSLARERILIGAPFPFSKDRVRTDTNEVRKHWASRFEENEYMGWYKDYFHGGNGMLIMNEDGFDKVLLGDDLADPNTGQRNGRPTGLLWNDEAGFERGGLGLNQLKENGKYRNILGFDDETGEAFHIGLLEDGSKMIRMAWANSTLLIGRGSKGNFLFNNPKSFVGIQLRSGKDQHGYQENWIGKK